jgi:hypothetical protein
MTETHESTHNKFLLVQSRNRLSASDLMVHQRLGERRFIKFIMSPCKVWVRESAMLRIGVHKHIPSPVCYKVDNDILWKGAKRLEMC